MGASEAVVDAARDSRDDSVAVTPAESKPGAEARASSSSMAKGSATKVPGNKVPGAKTSAGKGPAAKAADKAPAGKGSAKAPSKSPAPKTPPSKTTPPKAAPAEATLASRAAPARVDSTALEFAVTARLAHEPLTRAIARRTRNPELAERAAWAVTREAGRLRMSPSLLAAVLLVENRQLDSAAVSSQGAIGLMQVMPMHAGSYGCESDDLMNVDANICHGARILHLYLVRSHSITVALRRYNGCVHGANTPRCYRYPARVLQTAGRLRRDILASASPADRRVRM
jgi:soluble lytic murein transglycosylase-like protein